MFVWNAADCRIETRHKTQPPPALRIARARDSREDWPWRLLKSASSWWTKASERLHAFCSITLDGCFVIRDLKIIKARGARSWRCRAASSLIAVCDAGQKLPARPSSAASAACKLPDHRAAKGQDGRSKLYADIAHPINSQCREMIQERVLQAFSQEQVLAQQPGYVCRYDDFAEEEYDVREEWSEAAVVPQEPPGDAKPRIEPATGRKGPIIVQCRALRCSVATVTAADDDAFGEGII